jgi:hypothetical protein
MRTSKCKQFKLPDPDYSLILGPIINFCKGGEVQLDLFQLPSCSAMNTRMRILKYAASFPTKEVLPCRYGKRH